MEELRITRVMQRILQEVQKEPSHGYSLARKLKLDINVVYQSVKVLEKKGYVDHTLEEGQGPEKKRYRITEKGVKLLGVI